MFVATVFPGFDDQIIRKRNAVVPRNGTKTYENSWETAARSRPDWIFISTWNEWHEGSEIEPSREHADACLRHTRKLTREFRAP